jgi:hypothetical protein
MEPREGLGMVARPWEVVGRSSAAALMARWSGGVGARGEGTCGIYIVAPRR